METALPAHLDWLRAKGCTPASIRSRANAIRRLAAALPVPLLQATPAHLDAWAAALALRVQPDSVAAYTSHARSFFRWAHARGYVDADPARLLPTVRIPRRIPRPIAEADLMAAVAAAEGRVRDWLILAGWAGLRCQEIARLRREDVLDAAATPVILVGEHAAKGRRERLIPLSPFAAAALAPTLAARRKGWLFPRRDGRPGPVPAHRVSQLGGRHLRECGIGATMHQLRHRFGTAAWTLSHDLRMVQELLGHRDPKTTAGYTMWDLPGAPEVVASLPSPVA